MSIEERFEALLARIDTKVDALGEKVDDIHARIYGNGKPGMIVDQALQARQITELLEYAKKSSESIEKLKEMSPEKWLVKHWKAMIAVLVTIVLILHSIIPDDLSLWVWVSKLF